MPNRNHSANLCVVCGARLTHKENPEVVGRHPSGRPRLLCAARACRKTWNDLTLRALIVARWVESRGK